MSEIETILVKLADAFGPSGFESEARRLFQEIISEVCAEIDFDNLGSIIAYHRGRKETPKILLAAHLDEVGLMVRGILPGGQLKVVPLGSWWAPALLAQPVIIRSQNREFTGVIGAKPPHYLKDEEKNRQLRIEDLYLDVGARCAAEVAALGIAVGDPVVPAVRARALSPDSVLMGKAFDDRAGCAVIAQVLRELDDTHPNLVIGAGTVQEENGLKGAKSVATKVQPDLCLVLEGAPADDFPDCGPIIQGKLGEGPQIRCFDPTLIANRGLVKLALNEARNLGIPYQIAVRESGGTDGAAIQVQTAAGAPVLVIGIPVRYAHSHQGIINLNDLKAAVKLVKALLYQLDAEKTAYLKANPW